MPNNYNSDYTGEHNDGYEARIADLENTLAALENYDYIISTVASGKWRKYVYKSGKIEVDGWIDLTYANNSTWGGGKYMDFTDSSIPSDWLNSSHPIIITGEAHKTSGSGMPFVSFNACNNTRVKGYIFDPNPNSTGYPVQIHVHIVNPAA